MLLTNIDAVELFECQSIVCIYMHKGYLGTGMGYPER